MTCGAGMTNLVTNIVREKITENYDPEGAIQFIVDAFHIPERFIPRIISGRLVMVFDETGGGAAYTREEVPAGYIEEIGGLAPEWTKEYLTDWIRSILKIRNQDLFDLVTNAQTIINSISGLEKSYEVDFSGFPEVLGLDPNLEWNLTTNVTGYQLLDIYNRGDEQSKEFIHCLMDSNSQAIKVVGFAQAVDERIQKYPRLGSTIQWMMKTYGVTEDDLNGKVDGRGTKDTDWLYQDFVHNMQDLKTLYDIIHNTSPGARQQIRKVTDKQKEELRKYMEFYEQPEEKFGPVDPKAKPWDAGWISPEGHFFAACGSTANLIHLTLAPKIWEYMEYGKVPENPDYELEKRGYIKFHNKDVNYARFDIGGFSLVPPTDRQLDKLHDYAKSMGYGELSCPKGVVRLENFWDTSKSEWCEMF